MKTVKFRYIETILKEYPQIDKRIKEWEERLLYPDVVFSDENIGGGNGGRISDPTSTMATTLAEDDSLLRMKFKKATIERVLAASTKETRQIVCDYYLSNPRLKTWHGVAKDVNYSESYCRELRNDFFSRLADELKLL